MKLHSNRSNANRAARSALGKDAKAGVHFEIVAQDGKFGFVAGPVLPSQPMPVVEIAAAKTPKPKKAKAPKKAAKPKKTARVDSKLAELIRMLSRANGASKDELKEKFGWLDHTVRGAISNLSKKHAVESFKDNRGRSYRVAK